MLGCAVRCCAGSSAQLTHGCAWHGRAMQWCHGHVLPTYLASRTYFLPATATPTMAPAMLVLQHRAAYRRVTALRTDLPALCTESRRAGDAVAPAHRRQLENGLGQRLSSGRFWDLACSTLASTAAVACRRQLNFFSLLAKAPSVSLTRLEGD